ncbi:MAG: glycosyltransferase [Allosphingosinicella sp.]
MIYPLLWSRPSRQACQEQTVNTVAALARAGHEVTLLMPRGPGDSTLDAADLRGWFEVEGDFRLVQRDSRWAGERLLPSLMWLRQVFADPLLRGADLICSRIPAMLGAGLLAPLPFVTDHYRPWPDDLPLLRPLLRRTARRPDCLGLILHSEYAAGAWRRAGIESERILVAHNGTELRRMIAVPDRREARAALGLPDDRFIAVYAGRINAAKGLDQILALADLRPEILFLLVGSEGEGEIEAQARRRANVRVLPWAEPSALPVWLRAADLLLIPPSSAPLERHRNCVLPMKLYAYLAAGRPILAPDLPDTAELLAHGDTAWLVPPNAPRPAAEALDRLRADPVLARRLGDNARGLSEGLSWGARAAKIADFLEGRLKAQRSAYRSTVSAPTSGAVQAPTAAGQ